MADLERAYLHYILTGDEKNLAASLHRAESQASKTEKTLAKTGDTAHHAGRKAEEGSKGFGKLGTAVSSIGGLGKLGIAAAGLGGLAFGIKDIVSAGQAWQGQQAQLQNALRTTGNAGRANLDKLNEAIDKLALKGGFAPPAAVQGMTQLIRATGRVTTAIRDNALATNIARGTHKDYLQVTKAIALVEQGRTTGLSRLGIVLPKVTTATDALKAAHVSSHDKILKLEAAGVKFTTAQKAHLALTNQITPKMILQAKASDLQATKLAVLTRLTKLYGGSATAFSHTSQGAISNVHNALDILTQRLGAVFLPIITKVANGLSGLLGKAVHWIDGHRKQIDSFLKSISKAFSTMWAGVKPVLSALVSAIGTVATWLGKNKDAAKALGGVLAAVFVTSKITGFFGAIVGGSKLGVGALARLALGFNPLIAAIAVATAAYLTLHKSITNPAGSSPSQVAANMAKHGAGFATADLLPKLAAKGAFSSGGGHPGPATASQPGHHHYLGGLIRAFSSGGPVGGPGSYRDTVPAWLEPGEFVMRKGAVDSIGVAQMNSINQSGRAAPGQHRDVVINLRTYLGRRVIAEQVTRHSLEVAARR